MGKIRTFFAAALVAAISAGCSSESDLLDTVPANYPAAGVVNLSGISGLTPTFGTLKGFEESAELENAVVMARNNFDVAFTVRVKDRDGFEKALAANGFNAAGDNGGFKTFVRGEARCAVKGKQAWFYGRSTGFSPETVLENASKGSFREKNAGVAKYLESRRGGLACVAVSEGIVSGSRDEAGWIVIDASVKDNKLRIGQRRLSYDGAPVNNLVLTKLDENLLRRMPGGWPLVAAAGITQSADWTPLESLIGMAGGFQASGMMGRLLPYLEDIDGTVAIAARPHSAEDWTDFSLTDWDVALGAQMFGDGSQRAVKALRNYLAKLMLDPMPEGNGFKVDKGGIKLHAFSEEGVFFVFAGDCGEMTPMEPGFLKGECGGARIELPRGLITPRSAVDVEIAVGSADSYLTVALPGMKMPVLEAILSLFNR